MSKFDNRNQAATWFDKIFMQASRILAGEHHVYSETMQRWYYPVEPRGWFVRERSRSVLHRAVMEMILDHCYRPHDWHQLLLEWPHKSDTDPNRLAYTRDERAGEADRQVVTTIGKYLTRHFPDAPDNLIRDIVAQHTYGGDMRITTNLDEMVNAVIEGPVSCMSKTGLRLTCDDGEKRHPYAVYAPQHGWGMAIRKDGNDIMGRCLVWRGDHDDDADYKCFVRSYKREKGTYSHSGSDEAIESWLKGQGYQRLASWPDGLQLQRYDLRSGGYLMPYIDGGTQHVDEDSFCIDSNGYLDASNTDGVARDGNCECENCGARFNDDDEGGWVGTNEDVHVCQDCLDNDYTYAYSRRGSEYYIPNDRVIYVSGSYYDTNYLSDNNIVQLADGEYCDMDNAVWIESVDEYYHCNDRNICYAEDTERYELREDCWQCYATDKWYTDDTDSVEIEGNTYHPDDAPEVEEEVEDEGEQA